MKFATRLFAIASLFASALLSGCVTRPPTIAHVHLGHALTGVHVTPGRVGYLSVAEQKAAIAVESSHAAATSATLEQIKSSVAAAAAASTSEEEFGLKPALTQASNHI